MRIYLRNQNEAIFECDNFQTLEMAQAMCDGRKVRNEPKIIISAKSLTKFTKILPNEWHKIMSPEALKKTVEVSDTIKYRKQRIKDIRDEYVRGPVTTNYTITGKYAPLKHQLTMFKAITELNCAAILAEPGTCKTGAYLWGIEYRKQQNQITKCLVITLSHLKENVLEEMTAQTPNLKGVILSSKIQADKVINKKYKKDNKDYDVYIANYESMFSLVDLIPDDYFQMVILDEAHRIGSPQSNQTKAISWKFEHVPYKYIVTGTLNANNQISFFMPFRFMGADNIPEANYNEFRRRHFYTVDPDQRIWEPSPGTRELVKQLISNVSVCFKKEECIDLPSKVYLGPYKCELSSAQKEQYNNVRNELIFIVKEHCKGCPKINDCDKSCDQILLVKNILVKIVKLSQITAGFFIETKKKVNDNGSEIDVSEVHWFEENPKLNLLISTLQNIPIDKKVIIWSNWVASIKAIEKKIGAVFGADSYISVYGDTDAFECVKEFKRNNKKRFLIANQKKAGTGLNIQFSSYQIFFSNNYSFIVRDQAESRQHRQGQKEEVTIIDIVCEKTIDGEILKILKYKKEMSDDLVSLARAITKGDV